MPKVVKFKETGLTKKEYQRLLRLNTPTKIQDYLNNLPFDFAPGDKIDRSVQGILHSQKADCAGGAMLAAAALYLGGKKPYLLDLKTAEPDFDHIVALFKEGSKWGAISKTNHAVLRYREPVYANVRELAMSYFHEYFLPNGKKTLRSFSKPFDLSRYGSGWMTDPEAVVDIIYDLDRSQHVTIVSSQEARRLRKADKIEIKAGELTDY